MVDVIKKEIQEDSTKKQPVESKDDSKYSEYASFDYEEFARYPDNHFFEKVAVTGKVIQVIGKPGTDSDSSYGIRLATANGTDIVYISIPFDPGCNILENDRLTIYGIAVGTATYKAIFGQEVTIPAVIADEIVFR